MIRTIPSALMAIMAAVALIPGFLRSGQRRSGSSDRSWLGARVYGSAGAQAHSSPIYVQVSGERASSKEDAGYFLDWIDRLEATFAAGDRVPSAEMRAHVKLQLDAARAVYRR